MTDNEREPTDISRRGFLRSLIAAAVATQLPDLPAAKAETLIAAVEQQPIVMNGEPLRNLRIEDVGNGWYHLSGDCPDSVHRAGGLNIDFTGMNGGAGLFAGGEAEGDTYLIEHPTHVATRGVSIGATFSCYFKPGAKFKGHKRVADTYPLVVAPTIEHRPVAVNLDTQPYIVKVETKPPVKRVTPRAQAFARLPRWQRPGGR